MTPANTNIANHNSSPHLNGYLVYTGREMDGLIQLYIHGFGSTMNNHLCDAYFPNQQRRQLMYGSKRLSPPYILEEHGWFKDPDVFKEICTNLRFPNHPTQDETFREWRSAVLSTINKYYEALWTPNDGNWV
jgi:hypothetical protein